jgi:adenine-specific DNA methylase
MIPKDCKRLAEVDFPIAEVSKQAAREKSIRHGHPSTLHLWWARRPLASSRALLLALLLPDPCDPLCPEPFKHKAREVLPRVQGRVGPSDEDLRRALLGFIANFANWDLAAQSAYLGVSRDLVKAAYEPEDGSPYEPPLVVDPFAGGGSIPLEALRLGCEAFASDLNPVASLILKVMLEDIPRYGPELAQELRRVGAEIKRKAEEELAELYPKDPDGATPIAYLWARTVRCEAPGCGAEIPLVRSFWLAKKANRRRALRYRVERQASGPPRVEFEVFEPKSDEEVPPGTVARARATCLCCGAVLPPERVRAQLAAQRGGADVVFDSVGQRVGGARLLAVVTLRPGEQGRHYRLPTEADYEAVWKAQQRLQAILDEWEQGGRQGPCPVPDEPTPAGGGSGAGRAFSVQKYGMLQWGDLFTARQKVALVTLARLVRELDPRLASGTRLLESEGEGVREAVREGMAVVLDRCADKWASLVVWNVVGEKTEHVFGRQALPIVWDYCEANPFTDATGGYDGALEWVAKVAEAWPKHAGTPSLGQVQLADATEHPLPDETAHVWFTDPPYYDAVPYADLSDFFFVWLKRTLPGIRCCAIPSIQQICSRPRRARQCRTKPRGTMAASRTGRGSRKQWPARSPKGAGCCVKTVLLLLSSPTRPLRVGRRCFPA